MDRETIENILNFLKEKENKEFPQKWNLIDKLENHPDDIQYKYEGDLELSNTNIKKLPNDLYVEGYLNLSNTNITKLPNDLYVEGGLFLMGCSQLTELPDELYVGGNLVLNDSNITELPYSLYVGTNLYTGNTPLANKHTDDEIIEMIDSNEGIIIGLIMRYV
jgi:hypothetical protein